MQEQISQILKTISEAFRKFSESFADPLFALQSVFFLGLGLLSYGVNVQFGGGWGLIASGAGFIGLAATSLYLMQRGGGKE